MQLKVKNLHLKDYKRFTDLSITEIPETAKLVVLVGPNGSGKSSVFDAFISKARASVNNFNLTGGDMEQYYEKDKQAQTLHEVAQRVNINFYNHNSGNVNMKSAFQVRSAYRNEADFRINQFQASKQFHEGPRLSRIIDPDTSVSENYKQVVGKGIDDLFHASPGEITFDKYRQDALGDLHEAMCGLFSSPALLLQDFGAMKSGSFRFSKGEAMDFHYKNLSGGEKAAFDILLDVFVKREEAREAVFCIDEPEVHVAPALQGRLITSVLKLLPATTQLWIATHSIGVVREAYRLYRDNPDEVVFLDFSNRNFDDSVVIKPSNPNRAFWMNIYKITLDDLASLVAPQRIIFCEGKADNIDKGFDAQCYNKIFAEEFPDTLFISRGGSKEVIKSEHLKAIIEQIAEATEVYVVIDRDNMTDDKREEMLKDKINVLKRRELEDYLYDAKVIRTFLKSQGCDETIIGKILDAQQNLLASQSGPENIKDITRNLFDKIRKISKLPNLGNDRKEFALQHLVPALCSTQEVYKELKEDVFNTTN